MKKKKKVSFSDFFFFFFFLQSSVFLAQLQCPAKKSAQRQKPCGEARWKGFSFEGCRKHEIRNHVYFELNSWGCLFECELNLQKKKVLFSVSFFVNQYLNCKLNIIAGTVRKLFKFLHICTPPVIPYNPQMFLEFKISPTFPSC